jgi:hypothetical protein
MAREPGLGPLSPPGPPQPIEHARGDVLDLISHRAKAIVIGQGMDYITKMQQCGASDHSLTMLRGMLRRMTRAMYLYEVHATISAVDFDPTQ